MIEINLLPVREARRRESLRFQLSIAILSLFFAVIIIAYLNMSATNREQKVDKEMNLVQTRLAELQKIVGEIDKLKQEKAKLEQKRAVIQDLDRGRLRAAYILGELSQRTPEKVWMESLDKSGKSLKISAKR